jgi:hypothetical protein
VKVTRNLTTTVVVYALQIVRFSALPTKHACRVQPRVVLL